MFLRRIPQSFRIPRITPSPPSIRPSIQYPARSLLFSTTVSHGRLFLPNDIASVSNTSTIASSEPNDAALKQEHTDLAKADKLITTLTSIEDYEAALEYAFAEKNYASVEAVVDKLVDLYRSETALSFSIFHNLLQRKDVDQLSDSSILDILQLIRSSPYEATRLPSQVLPRTWQHRTHDEAIKNVILDILKIQIQDIEVPSGKVYLKYEPPAAVQQAFTILSSLLVKQPQVALDIFNTLLENGLIPAESVEGPDLLKSDDPQLIMFCGLAKAALHWNWPALVTPIIRHLLQTSSARHPVVPGFLTHLATSLLENQTVSTSNDSLRACLAIIRVHRVPDSIIRRFYETARRYNCGAEAAELYAFTRGVLFETQQLYPAPRDYALGWFMEYLYGSRQHNLCRKLAKEVLDDRLTIPIPFRARFITIATLTDTDGLKVPKGLWERFCHGSYLKDRKIIYANGPLALTMVQRLSTAIKLKKNQVEKEKAIPENHKIVLLNRDIRHINVFMHQIAAAFEGASKSFSGTPSELLSYLVQIMFIVGRFKDGVGYLRNMLHRVHPTSDEFRSCIEAMAAYDAGMAALVIEDLGNVDVSIDTKTCLEVLAQAEEQRDAQVVEQMKRILLDRGVDVGATTSVSHAVKS